MPFPRGFALAASVMLIACTAPGGETVTATGDYVPARFTDPDRATRLVAAVPAIDSLFRDFATRSHVPGIAWGLLIDGRLVHIGTAGVRDIANSAPVDSTTVFRIASMTKSFTAVAILQLRDAGRLSLDDPVDRYVPELSSLAYPTSDSPRLTIRHLLSHAEGFPEDNPWGDRQLDATDDDMAAMMRAGIPFSNPPGLAYEYSNFGFAILGRVVANVSGVPYDRYVAEQILQPLGLSATTLQAADVPPDRLAHGYRWEDETWKDEPPLPHGAFGAMGGMLTSTTDLGRYVGFLMGAWPPRSAEEDGPLSRASRREMQQLWRPRPSRATTNAAGKVSLSSGGYGFALGITQSCLFDHVVAHSGGLPGYGSQMRWLPSYGVGIIAMGNLTYTSWGGVIDRALDALHATGALQPREAQPSSALTDMHDAVSRLVASWDDALADSVAAMNLFLDESKDRRQAQVTSLVTSMGGACHNEGPFLVENALRGRWRMACDGGTIEVSITLAPTTPPRVQYLRVAPAGPAPLRAPTNCPE